MMSIPSIDDLHHTWSGRATDRMVGERDPFTAAVLDRLADGAPATVAYLAEATSHPVEEVRRRVDQAATAGYEVDADGAIVGAALTLNTTAHRFRVRGHDLHTWCGFDALFLPLLLGEPVTGQEIHLTVHANGEVTDVAPSTAQVAIVGSAVADCCDVTGPGSAVCTQMPLLSSPEAGETWLRGRHGVAVVDIPTGMDVARSYATGST
jgi:alkylmercury lyase